MRKPRLIYFDAPVSRGEECRFALHLAGYPRLVGVHDAVRDHPGVQPWYARP